MQFEPVNFWLENLVDHSAMPEEEFKSVMVSKEYDLSLLLMDDAICNTEWVLLCAIESLWAIFVSKNFSKINFFQSENCFEDLKLIFLLHK